MVLSEREEIELAALLTAEEREQLGDVAFIESCPKCGKTWFLDIETTHDEVERVIHRHPDVVFVQFAIVPAHYCPEQLNLGG